MRTNHEQLEATLERQVVVLASGSLMMLAVLAGITCTAKLMVSVVYQQRRKLAALKRWAPGQARSSSSPCRRSTSVLWGALLGVATTVPIAAGLDAMAVSTVGFENVVQTPPWALGAGFAIAVPIS